MTILMMSVVMVVAVVMVMVMVVAVAASWAMCMAVAVIMSVCTPTRCWPCQPFNVGVLFHLFGRTSGGESGWWSRTLTNLNSEVSDVWCKDAMQIGEHELLVSIAVHADSKRAHQNIWMGGVW